MKLENIPIEDFEYNLPDDRIAWFPKAERSSSKLLVYNRGEISTALFSSIPDYLPSGSTVFFNNTRVIEARLIFKKATGAKIEIFLLHPAHPHDYESAMKARTSVTWECLIGGASKWKAGQVLEKEIKINETKVVLTATYNRKTEDGFLIELYWKNESYSFEEILKHAGDIPLPPYIKRDTVEADSRRYQTSYAKTPGSVAAPTAGLHFTPEVLDAIKSKNIELEYLTLHVGAGTFKPVKAKFANEHSMHSESFIITKAMLEALLKNPDKQITAVGTTSMRTLESVYWAGILIHKNKNLKPDEIKVPQWMPYDETIDTVSKELAIESLLTWLAENETDKCYAETEIMIVPGYEFKIVDILITNFHQPGSTLLLLVAAFIGNDWKEIYEYAIKNEYRFLSYGDSSILIPKK